MIDRVIRRAIMIGFTLYAIAVIATAYAEGDPDAAKGLIADKCVRCHETPYSKAEQRTEAVDAPSFLNLANDTKQYPRERLRNSLRQPHFAMQQFTLSKRDIDNIIAYIDSLKVR